MKNSLKTLHTRTGFTLRSERGMAIVFALGIISLLFILALGFVMTTMVEQKTEENYRSLTVARMVAEAGLQRVIAGMRIYSSDVTKDYSNVLSHEGDGSIAYYEGLQSLIGDIEDGTGRTRYTWPVGYDPADSDYVTWQYLPSDHGPDKPIVARIAYVTTSSPDTPTTLCLFGEKLDPSASVDSGVNANAFAVNAISENFPASEATSIGGDGNAVIGRPGRDISELFLTTLPTWLTDNMAEDMSATNASPVGLLPFGTRWPYFDTLFSELSITDAPTQNSFKEAFCLDYYTIPEAYWITGTYDMRDYDTLYHRFNLARPGEGIPNDGSWDELTVASFEADSVPFSEPYADTSVTSIPWLKNWQSTGDMGSAAVCKNQIMANLLDYNDADNIATTDETVTTDAQNFNAAYVGNDKCPYINEVKLIFRVHIDRRGWVGPANGSDDRRQYRFRLRLQRATVEVVNMYGIDEDAADRKRAQVYVDYNFKFYVDYNYLRGRWRTDASSGIEQIWGNQIQKNLTFTDAESDVDGQNDRNVRTYAYDFSNSFDGWSDYYDTADDLGGPGTTYPITINEISAYAQLNSVKVKFYNRETQSKLYDFSFIEENADSMPILENYVPGNDVRMNLVVDYEVNDPRQNLLTTDWRSRAATTSDYTAATATGTTAYSTINAKNSNCDLPILDDVAHADSDPEPSATEPWDVSTAYIRNAPMQSPWELGFIHRGDVWQTINLKKYNSTEGVSGGGDAYADGDANILDQIKMTSATETYGKVNVNSSIDDALKALFEKMRVGSNIGSSEGPGTLLKADASNADEVTSGIAQILATAFETNSGGETDSTKHFYTRAQVLRDTDGVSELHDNTLGLSQTTDATQEELIGKFINLSTAVEQLPDQFTVIIAAQAIKDIGGGGTVNKDLNHDGSIADFNESTIGLDINGDGDALDNITETIPSVQTGTYDQYADEILGTKKILATVRRDTATNKFYILDYEYLD